MYMSWVDKMLNPYLSNLFIPKTHEAVEMLAAFLIGSNQTVSASPENGSGDTIKAKVAGKWLDFMWRKVLKARIKVLVWIKQGIIFGNGILKIGWDADKKQAWLSVIPIEDVYFDYFVPDMQDGEYIIHEVRRDPEDVKADTKYDLTNSEGNLIRSQVITGGEGFADPAKALFSTYDKSLMRAENKDKVLVMEVWCMEGGKPQLIKTLLPTSIGWRVARRSPNPNKWADGKQFRPFVKLRFKTSALPNRAYDMGAVFPTIHLQKAFNDLMRQYFDGVVMINQPMGKKRRGARINPMEMVRRPGGIITMGDITKDFQWDNPPDMKASIVEMLNRLDREFQAASMISSLLMQFSDTATGDSLEQQPLQALRDMIDQNIVDALSEAGQMVLAVSLSHAEGVQSIELYENEKERATLDFDPKNIDGMYDVRIRPDRQDNTTKMGQNKILVDFTKVVAGDQPTRAQYPSLMKKVYMRYLENGGVGDPDFFFQEDNPTPVANAATPPVIPGTPVVPGVVPPVVSPLQPDASGKVVVQ